MSIADLQQQLAALRHAGAQQFDPVRFHYLEALAQRALVQSDKVQGILCARLELALAAWKVRYECAQAQTAAVPAPPEVATPPLAALVHYLAQHAQEHGDRGPVPLSMDISSPRGDLKSVRHFRDTWSKLSTSKQVKQSMDQAPKNAGPLNSHMLVLRSLGLMRDISPDYLNRFVTYADTLLCLELRDSQALPPSGSASGPEGGKKPKARRSRPPA